MDSIEQMEELILPDKASPPKIIDDFSLDNPAGNKSSHSRKNSFTSLSPTLKERRRQTLKYFAQTQDLDKEEIMDFLQNEIRRKTSMDNVNNMAEMINHNENDSDCKDDFDSDIDENELEKNFILDGDINNQPNIDKIDDFSLDNNTLQDRDSENDESKIKNGEEPSWNELLLDDSTRQQFEDLAREYVGNIAEEKRKLQNEHYQLQLKYIKLQESNKSNEENIENLHRELNEKDEMVMKLENEVTTLSVDKQDLATNVAKLELSLQHNQDQIETLNATLAEYKNQNELLSQNLNELNIKMDETENSEINQILSSPSDGIVDENGDEISIGPNEAQYDKIMDNVELAFKTNKKDLIIEIINSLKANSLKSNDEIKTLIEEKSKLKTQMNDFEKEQQSLSLNNEALKNLVETHQTRLKNVQKQHQTMKNKYNDTKQLSEQLQIDINAKNEFIQQLKEQNEKLDNSNHELMIINSDLRHELEIYDQTILSKRSPSQGKKLSKYDSRKNVQHHTQISDRKSFDEDEEDDDRQSQGDNTSINVMSNMPSLILTDRDRLNATKQRRSSVPTSIYEQNLDIIVKSVNNDEYKFMEDLAKEKMTLEPQKIRSEILKRCHADAEKEFFFMMVLTCKMEISTGLGLTNSSVSDVSAQDLWVKAQERCVALHEFHDFIKRSLVQIAQSNKSKNEQIKHIWSSYNSMIADKLRQNDLKTYQENNPHVKIVDPEVVPPPKPKKDKLKMNGSRKEIRNGGTSSSSSRNGRQRAYTVSVVPYSDNQILEDEDEDEIYAAMRKNGSKKTKGMHKRRDSQNMKKTIIQSFNELQQQNQQIQQNQVDNDQQLQDIQTQNRLNNIRQTDTYDLL